METGRAAKELDGAKTAVEKTVMVTEDVIRSGSAARVVTIVSPKNPRFVRAWACPEEVVAAAFQLLQDKRLISPDADNDASTVRFMAKQRWGSSRTPGRTYIVFDVFHNHYDPDTAHLPGEDDLPVLGVWFSAQREMASLAPGPMASKANQEMRHIHEATGLGSRPPFSVDHFDGKVPLFMWPRSLGNATPENYREPNQWWSQGVAAWSDGRSTWPGRV